MVISRLVSQKGYARSNEYLEDQGEKGELRSGSCRSISRDRSENVRGSSQEVHDETRLVTVTTTTTTTVDLIAQSESDHRTDALW